MWGKISLHRPRKPTVGDPTLLDTTLDENQYGSFSPISSRRDGESSYSTKVSQAAPKLPDPSLSTNPAHRVTSSVYSRDTMVDHLRQRSVSSTYPDPRPYNHSRNESADTISPPRSPVFVGQAPGSRSSGQVSPIEHEPKQTSSGGSAANKFTSHLPVLRKRAESEQPSSISSERRQTRWDDFSGEPTSSDLGKFGQAAPGSNSFQAYAPKSAATPNSNIFGWGKEQLRTRRKFSETRATPSKHNNALPLSIREPWKGPSGRSPMVNPIQEQPRARSSSRVHLSRSNDRLNEYKTPETEPFSIVPSVVTTITGGEGNNKRAPATSRGARHIQVPEPSTPPHLSRAPPRVDLPEADLTATLADLKLTTGAEADQPTSRFSATTYEPTEAGSSTTASPRDSLDAASQTTENEASIMSRRRPIPSASAPMKQTARKPTPSQASGEFDKALPQCPPEQHAQNRIEMLEARRDSLARRKANIDTIIHELTQVIQPSSIAYDMAAREEVKKTVASLNNELAEIKREEHEIGLILLRLWKKRDEQDIYGANTGLWVKRVTS